MSSSRVIEQVSSIPANYSRLIARELELQERELSSLLFATTLTSAQLMSEDTLLTPAQQVQIVMNGLRISKDESIGLRLGKKLTPPTHGALGFLANSSPTLLTAVRSFQEFIPTRMSFIEMSVEESDDWIKCYFDLKLEADNAVFRTILDAASMSLLACIEFVLGRELFDGHLQFSLAAPHYIERYAEFIPCPVEFSCARNCLKIPRALKDIENVSSNHENYVIALQQCQQMLSQLPDDTFSTTYQVKKLILSYPPGRLSEEAVSELMFITKRTLARRLIKEGTGFRQIKEKIMAEQSVNYLRDTELSVESIAGLLNYHDSANFRRAFKRWYHCPPNEYREQLKSTSIE
jgi:AraC-like DNA-binding protein